jgi:hypothetical protein
MNVSCTINKKKSVIFFLASILSSGSLLILTFLCSFVLFLHPYNLTSFFTSFYSYILSFPSSFQNLFFYIVPPRFLYSLYTQSADAPVTPYNHYFAHCQRFVINQSKFEGWQHFRSPALIAMDLKVKDW